MLKMLYLKNIKFFFSSKLSRLYFWTKRGIVFINFFGNISYKLENEKLIIKQNGFKQSFFDIFSVLKMLYSNIYMFRLKIKGLGFRWRTITSQFHYIFFNYTNFFYFFVPLTLLVKLYKKRMILVSYYWAQIRLIVCHLVLLRKFGPYNLYGIRWVKQIVLLKKSGKKV